jgi:3-oxoacyl-[acyl-carrier protein] reductase
MLKGKTALVTGASRGIGRGIALKFAEHGAFVGINYVSNREAANKTLDMIHDRGGEGALLKGDVSVESEVRTMVKRLVEKKKKIDVLVNNAGIYIRNKFEDISPETWEKILAVNLTGCYYLCQATLPYMGPHGKIIFISSQLAFRGSSHGADYATSKAGILGLMRSLALELAGENIYVNAVAPGTIDTDLIAGYSEEMRKQRIEQIPLGRLGTPEDVANVCLFLASDLSNYVTGETINVNGGLYIH